jgi:hypothetical protein
MRSVKAARTRAISSSSRLRYLLRWNDTSLCRKRQGRKLLLFATLHYWVEQAAMVGLALRGLGYDVTVAYLPYGDWRKEINEFDLRRQDLQKVLAPLNGLVKPLHY